MTPQQRIARRFDAAADTYADATPIQRQAAAALAARIVEAGMPPGARIAEFGCGVGYLAEALLEDLDPDLWLASDIAPAMLAALNRRLRHRGLTTALIDAASPELEPDFDLVCSSLTLQWLPDPAAAVRRWRALVKPGGLLAVATLAEGSFAQWRAALAAAGAPEPQPGFASLTELGAWFGPSAQIWPLTLIDRHASGLHFARAARAAGIDAGAGRALDAGAMRRALAAFEAGGAATTYEVVLILERPNTATAIVRNQT